MIEWVPLGLAVAAVVATLASLALWLRGQRRAASLCQLPVPIALVLVTVGYLLGPAPHTRVTGLLLFALLLGWTALLLLQARRREPWPALFWFAVAVQLAMATGLAWLALAFRIF